MCDHSNLPKCCCIHCSKEIYVRYFNKHMKNCKMINKKRDIDYVICPICGKRLKEINTRHLLNHNMTVNDFDKKYPMYDRLSKNSRNKKATFSGKKHTEEHKMHMSSIMKGRYSGRKHTEEHKKMLSKISKDMWKNDYDKLYKSHTLEGYIDKYGEIDGKNRWFSKNNKISKSNRKINDIDEYKIYKNNVHRITKMSIKHFKLKNIDKRSRDYHLDHRISICYGFRNNISYYMIGSIYNLEIIPSKSNTSKQHKISMSVEELLNMFENDSFYKELMDLENNIKGI